MSKKITAFNLHWLMQVFCGSLNNQKSGEKTLLEEDYACVIGKALLLGNIPEFSSPSHNEANGSFKYKSINQQTPKRGLTYTQEGKSLFLRVYSEMKRNLLYRRQEIINELKECNDLYSYKEAAETTLRTLKLDHPGILKNENFKGSFLEQIMYQIEKRCSYLEFIEKAIRGIYENVFHNSNSALKQYDVQLTALLDFFLDLVSYVMEYHRYEKGLTSLFEPYARANTERAAKHQTPYMKEIFKSPPVISEKEAGLFTELMNDSLTEYHRIKNDDDPKKFKYIEDNICFFTEIIEKLYRNNILLKAPPKTAAVFISLIEQYGRIHFKKNGFANSYVIFGLCAEMYTALVEKNEVLNSLRDMVSIEDKGNNIYYLAYNRLYKAEMLLHQGISAISLGDEAHLYEALSIFKKMRGCAKDSRSYCAMAMLHMAKTNYMLAGRLLTKDKNNNDITNHIELCLKCFISAKEHIEKCIPYEENKQAVLLSDYDKSFGLIYSSLFCGDGALRVFLLENAEYNRLFNVCKIICGSDEK